MPARHTDAVAGETSLSRLLASMDPRPLPGRFTFVSVEKAPPDVEVLASVVEPEGLSLVVPVEDAERLGLDHDFLAGWITLHVHSALDAVGLTAAVSVALADAGISCNVIAGHRHDHLLVPFDRLAESVALLHDLSGSRTVPDRDA